MNLAKYKDQTSDKSKDEASFNQYYMFHCNKCDITRASKGFDKIKIHLNNTHLNTGKTECIYLQVFKNRDRKTRPRIQEVAL